MVSSEPASSGHATDWEAIAVSYLPEWKPVVGYENLYEVSSVGEVRFAGKSHANGRPLFRRAVPPQLVKGYARVKLWKDHEVRYWFVHRLVAYAFWGSPSKGKDQIRHLDGNRLNNRVENLAWGNPWDNAFDRDIHGRTASGKGSGAWTHPECIVRGSRQGGARFTEGQIVELRHRWRQGETQTALAREFGVDQTTLSSLLTGKSWKHVPLEPTAERYRGANAKLKQAQVKEIRDRRTRGERLKELAREFGVSPTTICSIARHKDWKDV